MDPDAMNPDAIFGPVLVQVWLTLVVFVLLAVRKARALKAGGIDRRKTSLHPDAWPDSVLQVSNNLRNQAEAPVLFYVVCVVLWALEAVGTAAVALAWVFAISRIVHSFVHTGSNDLRFRMPSFLVGVIALAGLAGIATSAVLGG